jgi:hypothetical protein
MAVDFEIWIKNQFAATGAFSAMIVLLNIDGDRLEPLKSTYVNVIGDELTWRDMKGLLGQARVAWSGVAFFVAQSDGQPLPDGTAKAELRIIEQRVREDRMALNDGFFFDTDGRMLRVDPVH